MLPRGRQVISVRAILTRCIVFGELHSVDTARPTCPPPTCRSPSLELSLVVSGLLCDSRTTAIVAKRGALKKSRRTKHERTRLLSRRANEFRRTSKKNSIKMARPLLFPMHTNNPPDAHEQLPPHTSLFFLPFLF